MRDSLDSSKTSPAFSDFENKLKNFESKKDNKGILDYLLTLKDELLALPISHKNSALTI